MATFEEALEAMRVNKKIRHDNWYDGQWILWENQDKHLMLSPKQLLSEKWEIEKTEETSKKSAKKKDVAESL
jgi:hypothetical protein